MSRTLSSDTHPGAEAIQIGIFRRLSPAVKVELVVDACRCAWQLMLAGVRARHSAATSSEIHGYAARLWSGTNDEIPGGRAQLEVGSMEALSVMLLVVDVLDRVGTPYHIGGSFASSIHGFPRQTRDADLVARLAVESIAPFVSALSADFYVDSLMILEAIQRRGSFNVIHLASGFKVDIFVQGSDPFDEMEFGRRQELDVRNDPPRRAWVKSPEDTVLRKLQWFRMGGEVSERQWTDVLGVLKVQGGALDLAYLKEWGASIGVSDLLEKALLEA